MQEDAILRRRLPDLRSAEAEGAASPSFAMPRAASASSSSSSSGSLSPPRSLQLSPPSSSPSSASAASSCAPLPQRRNSTAPARRRHAKSVRLRQESHLAKPFSEPNMFTMKDVRTGDFRDENGFSQGSSSSPSAYRRCMTDTDFNELHGLPSQAAPDLLQLFSIFQFNKPEKPPARMLINVTLVGNIQPVRLLVAYDASVQDVIIASLKGYAKEGWLPKNASKIHNYGLHYSPFCLESINPTEPICALGTRNFFLFPSSVIITNPAEGSDEMKPWWNIFRSLLA